jgi:uncharacterized protein
MLGEELQETEIRAQGLDGDRGHALFDDEAGKLVSAKRPKLWGRLFEYSASIADGTVQITFPDGTTGVVGDDDLADRLSADLGRRVSFVSSHAPEVTFDEDWARDLKDGAPPYLDAPTRLEGDEEIMDASVSLGVPGRLFDFGAVHIVTTSSLRALSELAPDSAFGVERFRPNIVVETSEEGFVETAWAGRTLRIGDVALSVQFAVPRCVMTTLPQGDLPKDPDVLRTIAKHSMVEFLGKDYPCLGVYAEVATEGTVRTGDPVVLD